jgi:DNA-binding MarR family transcriptional regulator
VYMHLSSLRKCICTHTIRAMKKLTQIGLCNCFAVRQAARHLTRLYERRLADVELTSAQLSILVALGEAGELCMGELATAMVMDRTTLLRAVKPLVEGQLVVKRPNVQNPRQLMFMLSANGTRRLNEGLASWSKAQEEFEAAVGSERAARMRRDLLALADLN